MTPESEEMFRQQQKYKEELENCEHLPEEAKGYCENAARGGMPGGFDERPEEFETNTTMPEAVTAAP